MRLGLIPRGEDADAREREFVAALSEALSVPIEVHRAQDYRVVLVAMEQRLVDFAWLPPIPAARAVRARLADAIAVAARYGDTSYTTVLVARADSPIASVEQLRQARVAWVDRESASGYLVMRAALSRAGVRLTEAFAREVFVRSHGEVARAVLDREVDVGATCAHEDREGAKRIARSPYTNDEGLTTRELRILFEAGPIPSDVFAVRRDLPVRLRATIEAALLRARPERLHVAARALMHADTFTTPTAEHRRMLESLIDG